MIKSKINIYMSYQYCSNKKYKSFLSKKSLFYNMLTHKIKYTEIQIFYYENKIKAISEIKNFDITSKFTKKEVLDSLNLMLYAYNKFYKVITNLEKEFIYD